MFKTIMLLLTFLFTFAIVSSANSAEIYINQSNFTNIEQFIVSAKPEDKIIFSEGTYELQSTMFIANKNKLSIIGVGTVWIIIPDVNQDVISVNKSQNILIQNIHARHKNPLKAYECHGSVLTINNSSKIIVDSCELNGCGAIGVSVNQCQTVEITKCYIHDNTFVALYLSSSDDIKIKYNIIENNKSFLSIYNVKYLEMYGDKASNNQGYWE